ncbi:tRNA(Met) cytidine acetyltransferase TmcA [Litchfieldella qijiaojingensis]|uniref:tRNA(Met) cytidine acetyltransferase TmcA n=1 Tax=Litchfieldella qijiaojingensis TaxID=980347 RepID=A0ABQ2Z1V3_9GAMM|nr:GNAT family N-acetyltransferase [Halomonas qijiaojingensis]GGX99317.1 tRNA(Met) cytidine acetyltransferase TmcA [Halomonas qijiaojingensis]
MPRSQDSAPLGGDAPQAEGGSDNALATSVRALLDWRAQLAARRWRGLVWVTGEATSCRQRAMALWQAERWQAPLWLAGTRPDELAVDDWLPAAKARTRLGGEQDLVIFDAVSAESGFDPDAFGALWGTVRAGGLLVLLTPAGWGQVSDADYRRLAEYPYRPEQLHAHYLRRLARQLAELEDVARWTNAGEVELPTLSTPTASVPMVTDPDCATHDQAEAVARLTHLRRRRPLVLTADRGRGKSSALGIACARRLAAGERLIWVTAPRPAAVEPVFERLAALCPEGRRQANAFEWTHDGNVHRVCFLAPDVLSAKVAEGDVEGAGGLLLVDEAAAIPAPALGQWLRHFPRIVFATTIHGYEGSGRGFALRFRAHLERETPDWHRFHLEAPIRFAAGDPLERLTSRLLMLDAEPAPYDARLASREAEFIDCRPDELADDEPRLRELFGLLVQAHYRTRPSDLRRLLDGPGTRIATLEVAHHIQGVVACVDEGGFPEELAEAVALGKRRPRGHLLAQSLAAHAGSRQALTSRLRRVMRIAVHEACRRQGLGQRLFEAELARAHADGIDLLGASFGAEPGLIAFWQRNGCMAVRLGLTREASSGEHALMVVRGVSDAGQELARELQRRFQCLLPTLLAFELKTLDPGVAAALLAESSVAELTPEQLRDIDDVALGQREPALVRPALQALVRHALAAGASPESDDARWLVAALFQGRETAWLATQLGVPGRRQVQVWLRDVLAHWRQRWA